MISRTSFSFKTLLIGSLLFGAGRVSAQENQRPTPPLQQMVWVDRDGTVLEKIGDPQAVITGPILSHDGSKIAVRGRNVRDGDDDIWIYDLKLGIKTQATRHPSNERQPCWSPDGKTLVYFSYRNGPANLYMVGDAYNGEHEFLITPHETYAPTWSSDGRYILYHYHDQTDKTHDNRDLWYVEVDAPEPTQFTDTPTFKEAMPRFSPDGKYVVYGADESGTWEAYIKPFPVGERIKISEGGGVYPRWNGAGTEIYFWSGNNLVAVSMTDTPNLKVGEPTVLFSGDQVGMGPRAVAGFNTIYEVAPDGQRFIVVQNSLLSRSGGQ